MSDQEKNQTTSEMASQLDIAWKYILQEFQQKAADHAREFGAGIACFMFLKNPTEETNCKYCYGARDVEQEGPWKSFVLSAPNRKTFLGEYDPETNYAICTSIPIGEEFLSGIKLFAHETGEEIILPNLDPDLEELR